MDEKEKKQYIVRKFQKEDARTLSEMIRSDILSVNTDDPEWERDYLYNFYTDENIIKNATKGHTYVIEDIKDKIIVATGTITKDSPARDGAINESEISACFVSPKRLRKGIGTLLFEILEKDEYFFSASRVWLTTSVYAAPFYEKIGYKYTFGYRMRNQDKLIEMEKYPNTK